MATAGSRNGRLERASSSSTSQNPIEPLPAGDDGEFGLESEHFWPPETNVDRAPPMPSAPRSRRRRGTRSPRNGDPRLLASSSPADQPAPAERSVNTPLDLGPLTGNEALAPYELIEAIGVAAARSDDDAQSARLVAAIVPLTVRLVPDVSASLWPLLPDLLAATARVAELLRRRPANRPLLALLPMLLRRSVAELRQRLRDGQPVTGDVAAQVLTQQAATIFNLRRSQTATAHDESPTI
jgi:hypothetical protein